MKRIQVFLCSLLFCVVCFAENDTVFVVKKQLNDVAFEYEESSMESFIINEQGDTLQKITYWWESVQEKWEPLTRYDYSLEKEQEIQMKWDDGSELWEMNEMTEIIQIDTLSVSCVYRWDSLSYDWVGRVGRANDVDGSIEYFDGTQTKEMLTYQKGTYFFKWDDKSRTWQPNKLQMFSGYDEAGNSVLNDFNYDADRDGWVLQEKSSFDKIFWSEDSSRFVKEYYKIQNGKATEFARLISYYDEFGQVLVDSSFSITENGMELTSLTRNQYINDTLLQETEFRAFKENIGFKDVFSYDEDFNNIQSTKYRYTDGQWQNFTRSENVYNDYGQIVSIDYYSWSKRHSSWNESSMTTLIPFEDDSIWVRFVYNDSEQNWGEGKVFVNLYDDSLDDAVGEIAYFYENPEADPIPLTKWYRQNDSTVVYDNENDQWFSQSSLTQYDSPAEFYKNYLSEDKPVATVEGIGLKTYLYPTIAGNTVTIVNSGEEEVISIYDLSSVLRSSVVVQPGETVISLSELAPGMYYAKLNSGAILQFVKK